MSSIFNSYNRPNSKFLCGRSGLWQKPCGAGPNPDGSCGGTAVCQPTKSGDRWRCRRSRQDGGGCDLGPLPDGTCCLTQPACKPSKSLRVKRFRLSVIAALVVVALVCAFGVTGGFFFASDPPLRDAGTLSPKHAAVVGEAGCKACHEAHGQGPLQVLKTVFEDNTPSKMTGKCLDCHVFEKEETSVHKAGQCSACHSEHKGSDLKLIKFNDQQCHTCHKVKFSDFGSSHPAFGDTFPHRQRTKINFDHNAHIGTHFKDARYSKAAPEEGCISCHSVGAAAKAVPVKSFAENCGSCHEKQISAQSLNLLTVPEFEGNPFDKDATETSCVDKGSAEVVPGEEYESVSTEALNPIAAVMLDVDPDNIADYQDAVARVLRDMTDSGAEPIAKLLDKEGAPAAKLLAGLNADLVKAGACAWVSNEEFEPVDEGTFGGWQVQELSLSYRAKGHSDPVLKSWYDYAADAENDELSVHLLKPDGPGACLSCHSVNNTGLVEIAWKAGATSSNKLHRFDHRPHLNVLGPGSQCGTCHIVKKNAKYSAAFSQDDPKQFESNFLPIKKETCSTCHNEKKVKQDCSTCHEYHENPAFRAKMDFDSVEQK